MVKSPEHNDMNMNILSQLDCIIERASPRSVCGDYELHKADGSTAIGSSDVTDDTSASSADTPLMSMQYVAVRTRARPHRFVHDPPSPCLTRARFCVDVGLVCGWCRSRMTGKRPRTRSLHKRPRRASGLGRTTPTRFPLPPRRGRARRTSG